MTDTLSPVRTAFLVSFISQNIVRQEQVGQVRSPIQRARSPAVVIDATQEVRAVSRHLNTIRSSSKYQGRLTSTGM